jgi:hypothetical protein
LVRLLAFHYALVFHTDDSGIFFNPN